MSIVKANGRYEDVAHSALIVADVGPAVRHSVVEGDRILTHAELESSAEHARELEGSNANIPRWGLHATSRIDRALNLHRRGDAADQERRHPVRARQFHASQYRYIEVSEA